MFNRIKTLFPVTLFFLLLIFLSFNPVFAAKSGTPVRLFKYYDFPVKFRIYIPASAMEGDPCPVLYLLHGQSQTEAIWEEMGIVRMLDEMIKSGEISPMIVVMPREEKYLEDLNQADYDQIIIEQLFPYIESNFPVTKEKSGRAIGGISRGAVWAQKIAFNQYGYFGALGQHSLPAAFFSNYYLNCLQQADPDHANQLKIWIDSGADDPYLKGALKFRDQLTELKIHCQFEIEPGGHDLAYWKAHLREYLQWYDSQLN